MNLIVHRAWMLGLASTLFAAGCNPDWSDRIPEVTGPAAAHSDAGTPAAASEAAPGSVEARPPESAQDAALSAKVEAALKAEPDLHGTSIAVRSLSGVVTLSGTTPDPQLRSMAAEVALSVEGVKHVRNEIELGREA